MIHLLIALAQPSKVQDTAAHVLNGLGVTSAKLQALKQPGTGDSSVPDLSDGVKRTLERAVSIARKRKDKSLASAHLLAGALEDAATLQILEQVGTTKKRVGEALSSLHFWTDET